jgi:hypothetical protein
MSVAFAVEAPPRTPPVQALAAIASAMQAEMSSLAVRRLCARQDKENSDAYAGVVCVLNPKLRIIRNSLQWVLQAKRGAEWKNFAYCATKEGLLLRIKGHLQPAKARQIVPLDILAARYCDAAAWSVVGGLPEHFKKGG